MKENMARELVALCHHFTIQTWVPLVRNWPQRSMTNALRCVNCVELC